MKLFKKLIALIMVVVLMAGCTFKTNAGLDITKDGKISMVMIMAFDNEFIDTYLTISEDEELQTKMQDENFDPNSIQVKTHTDSERWAFIEDEKTGGSLFEELGEDMEGFTKTKYDQNGFKGYILTKEVGTLDEVTKESASARVDINDIMENEELADEILFVKSGDTYKSNMKLTADSDSDDLLSGEDIAKLKEHGAEFDLSFVITLPNKAISSNADSTENDGKTLKWSLTSSKDLEFEFKLDDAKETSVAKDEKEDKKDKETTDSENSNLLLYIGIGVGVLVLLIIIIAIIVASSKKKNVVQQPVQPTVMSPTYGPAVQPLDPVQPVQPAQPVEPPVQPVQPTQPVEPQDPNNMNNTQM